MVDFQKQLANPIQKTKSPQNTATPGNVSADMAWLQRLTQADTPLDSKTLMTLQRTQGNQFVQRLIEHRTQGSTLQRMKFKRDKFDRFLMWAASSTAKRETFGKGSDRRKITDSTADYASSNSTVFSSVTDVTVKNKEHSLTGRYYVSKKTKGKYAGRTILFLSGSGGSAEDYSQPVAKHYAYQGANMIAVNYRGFGGSTYTDKKGRSKHSTSKELNDATFNEDARAIFNWTVANKENNPGNIVILGYSLGGPVAAGLATQLATEGVVFGGLILHSSLDSIEAEAIRSQGEYLGKVGAEAVGSTLDTKALLAQLAKIPGYEDLPLMIMSGSSDEEQLDIDVTKLDKYAKTLGFNNVFSGSGPGGHMQTSIHFSPEVETELDKFMGMTKTGG